MEHAATSGAQSSVHPRPKSAQPKSTAGDSRPKRPNRARRLKEVNDQMQKPKPKPPPRSSPKSSASTVATEEPYMNLSIKNMKVATDLVTSQPPSDSGQQPSSFLGVAFRRRHRPTDGTSSSINPQLLQNEHPVSFITKLPASVAASAASQNPVVEPCDQTQLDGLCAQLDRQNIATDQVDHVAPSTSSKRGKRGSKKVPKPAASAVPADPNNHNQRAPGGLGQQRDIASLQGIPTKPSRQRKPKDGSKNLHTTPVSSTRARQSKVNHVDHLQSNAGPSASPNQTTPKNKKRNNDRRRHRSSSREKTPQQQVRKFPDHLTPEQIQVGLDAGELLVGHIRVNPRNYTESYISNRENRMELDYLVASLFDRSGALDGDLVVFCVKPEAEWKAGQKSVTIVGIQERIHSRVGVGNVTQHYVRGKKSYVLHPRDNRVPRMEIVPVTLPADFTAQPAKYKDILFAAKIVHWADTSYALGTITEIFGQAEDLAVQSRALLAENHIQIKPYPDGIMNCVRTPTTIDESEYAFRMDLRDELIFTIDPLTARDLDDAVSCKALSNGNFEVGVHIADVAYHIEPNSDIDKIVRQQATSVYLVERAYHMLPLELCIRCSLLPGIVNRAFSVIWELTPSGEVVTEKFSRTVIKSAVQLAYEHAQMFIDDTDKLPAVESLPDLQDTASWKQIGESITHLQNIAKTLRMNRFKDGALRIDKAEYSFSLSGTGEPDGYYSYERRDAHFLIEEFMILANIRVAMHISKVYPDIAFLRRHDDPQPRLMKELCASLEAYGVKFDSESSGSIYDCLQSYNTDDIKDKARYMGLSHMIAKSMVRAEYFCTADSPHDEYFHYALSVPFYTHFTSPIRRYADIMVHRLLAASLGYTEKPNHSRSHVQDIADICNIQKQCAKKAGEASKELYLAHYIDKLPHFRKHAIVIDVKDRSFDVLLMETGSILRVYTNTDSSVYCEEIETGTDRKSYKQTVNFPQTDEHTAAETIIQLFEVVKINVTRKEKTTKLRADLVHPDTELD